MTTIKKALHLQGIWWTANHIPDILSNRYMAVRKKRMMRDIVYMAKVYNESSNAKTRRGIMADNIARIKSHTNPAKKTVAFCFETRAYRNSIGNIIEKLKRSGKYNVITLVGEITGDKYEKGAYYLPSVQEYWSQLDFVDLFITPRPFEWIKLPAPVCFYFHDIQDSPVGDIEYVNRLYLDIDYFVIASEQVAKAIKRQIAAGKHDSPEYKNKQICLVKAGYTKLDRNLAYFKKHSGAGKTIIFATTCVEGKDMVGLIAFPGYAESIIKALLTQFPDYEIIFRPHPLTTHRPEVIQTVECFKGTPNFIYDDNAASYIENYSRSAVMVTDMSGTAYTYAMTTLRPVVFFLHDKPETMRRFGEYQYFKDMEKIGFITETVDGVIETVKKVLSCRDIYQRQIREYRSQNIYNLNKSEDYFVSNIRYLLDDIKNADWEYV